jgi:hypothetical protein
MFDYRTSWVSVNHQVEVQGPRPSGTHLAAVYVG